MATSRPAPSPAGPSHRLDDPWLWDHCSANRHRFRRTRARGAQRSATRLSAMPVGGARCGCAALQVLRLRPICTRATAIVQARFSPSRRARKVLGLVGRQSISELVVPPGRSMLHRRLCAARLLLDAFSVSRARRHHRGIDRSRYRLLDRNNPVAVDHAVIANNKAPVPSRQVETTDSGWKAQLTASPTLAAIDGVAPEAILAK